MLAILIKMMIKKTNKQYIIRFTVVTTLSLLLLFLWIFPLTGIYFDALDNKIFYFLNGTLKNGKAWQLFWAVTNKRIFDVASALFVLIMVVFHMYTKKNSEDNVHPHEKFIYFCIFIALTIIINKVIFSSVASLLDYHRQSPSLVLEGVIKLSKIITSFEFKDVSKDCFPGDHATVLICSTIYFYLQTL